MKTQMQMYQEAEQKIFRQNQAFMDMVNDPVNPLTKHDLERLIARRPEKYARFSGFLETLR